MQFSFSRLIRNRISASRFALYCLLGAKGIIAPGYQRGSGDCEGFEKSARLLLIYLMTIDKFSTNACAISFILQSSFSLPQNEMMILSFAPFTTQVIMTVMQECIYFALFLQSIYNPYQSKRTIIFQARLKFATL